MQKDFGLVSGLSHSLSLENFLCPKKNQKGEIPQGSSDVIVLENEKPSFKEWVTQNEIEHI